MHVDKEQKRRTVLLDVLQLLLGTDLLVAQCQEGRKLGGGVVGQVLLQQRVDLEHSLQLQRENQHKW